LKGVWAVHWVPSQRSASVAVTLELLWKDPTAVQAAADVHETPLSVLFVPPVGMGTALGVHVAPSQCSARADWPAWEGEVPTALQALPDVHETASNEMFVTPVGLGTVWIVHVFPFHRSARADSVPGPLPSEKPTASHPFAERHVTEASPLLVAPLGSGVGTSFHALPFQVAANVCEGACPGAAGVTAVGPKNPASPTAMHALADAQDTSRSVPLTTPSGATGCWSVHPEAFAACAVGRANAATTTLPTANSLANIARADDT
jgi:hypothetical protein